MGYTTDLFGAFLINKKVDEDTCQLLRGLSTTRRMKRDPSKLARRLKMKKADVIRMYGSECQLWVGDTVNCGQSNTPDIVDYNAPPEGQPSLWCQWELSNDRRTIHWDGGDKFYDYIGWIMYLIEVVLAPRGYSISGQVEWVGEDRNDRGRIDITDNVVSIKDGLFFYVDQQDRHRIITLVNDYLNNPLKEVIDEAL